MSNRRKTHSSNISHLKDVDDSQTITPEVYTCSMPQLTSIPKRIPIKFNLSALYDKPIVRKTELHNSIDELDDNDDFIGLDLVNFKPTDARGQKIFEQCRKKERDPTLIEEEDLLVYFEEDHANEIRKKRNKDTDAEKSALLEEKLEEDARRRLEPAQITAPTQIAFDKFYSREYRLEAAQNTFTAVKEPIKEHPTKKIKAVRQVPLLPLEGLWKHQIDHLIFQVDYQKSLEASKQTITKLAILKGFNESEERGTVDCYLPTKETLEKFKDGKINQSKGSKLKYESTQKFRYHMMKQESDKAEHNYILINEENAVRFIPVTAKMLIQRLASNTIVVERKTANVRFVDANPNEKEKQEKRLEKLG